MVDWALATTPANAEHLVCSDLERLKYQHLFFKRRSTRVHCGRVVVGLPPAFPRYIMVPFGQCWDVLHDVWRVLGIVCFGDEVAKVREREVDLLVERCGGGDVLPAELVERQEPYRVGDLVRVGGYGLASGHNATYSGLGEDGTLRLMFDMMGRMVPLDVDERDVFSLAPKPEKKRKRNGRGRHRIQAELRT